MTPVASCPDCGARLSAEQWSAGLCLSCLLELGLQSHADPADAAVGAVDAPTASRPATSLAAGQILGDRYRIRAPYHCPPTTAARQRKPYADSLASIC